MESMKESKSGEEAGSLKATSQSHRHRLLRLWAIVAVIVTVGLTVLFGWIVGAVNTLPDGRFNWEVAATVATAFATIALAGGTFTLAFTALEDAGASRELAELTRDDMWLRDRPTLVITSYARRTTEPSTEAESLGQTAAFLAITVQNVGLAPAMYLTVSVAGFDSMGDAVLIGESSAVNRVIPPNEEIDIPLPIAERGNIEDLSMTEITVRSVDRRLHESHGVFKINREGQIFLKASDSASERGPRTR
jgi:hypothetical protein